MSEFVEPEDHVFLPSGLCRKCAVTSDFHVEASIRAGVILPCAPERTTPWDVNCGVQAGNLAAPVYVTPPALVQDPWADLFAATPVPELAPEPVPMWALPVRDDVFAGLVS